MIERVHRRDFAEPDDEAPAPDSAEAASASAVFVLWPRAALARPPVRHLGDGPDVGLTPFEIAVAGACMLLAQPVVTGRRYRAAMRRGGRAIDKRRREMRPGQRRKGRGLGDETFAMMVKLESRYHRPSDAGGDGYDAGRAAFDRNRDGKVFTVDTSAAGILRAAGVGRNARSVAALEAALDRLTEDVRIHPPLPPVLAGWRRLRRGIRLRVSGSWLPARAFGRVAWPPPTRGSGSTVVALYLFCHGADQRPDARGARIDFTALVDRLGARARKSADANRAVNRALERVNRHLEGLGAGALAALGLAPAFAIEADGDAVRIVAAPPAAEPVGEDIDVTIGGEDDDDYAETPHRRRRRSDDDIGDAEERMAAAEGLSPRRWADPKQQRLEWQMERAARRRDD